MDDIKSFRPFLVSTILLIVLGWAGLFLLLNFTLPTLWPRWGFFALIVLALTGTTLPISFTLNRVFPSNPPVEPAVIVRQSLWVGVYFAVLAWLSVGRILNFSIGLWLALGIVAIEYLIRVREVVSSAPPKPKPIPPQPAPEIDPPTPQEEQ
jgi:hypothetical protein